MLVSFTMLADASLNETSIPLFNILGQKINEDPFRLITFLIFMGAIVHTFFAGKLKAVANHLKQKHGHETYGSQCFHWLGEVEAIFGLWLIPLVISFIAMKGWSNTVEYFFCTLVGIAYYRTCGHDHRSHVVVQQSFCA